MVVSVHLLDNFVIVLCVLLSNNVVEEIYKDDLLLKYV